MDIDKIISQEYAKGTPVPDIAKIVNRHESTVTKRARAQGIKHPNQHDIMGKQPRSLKENAMKPKQVSQLVKTEAALVAAKEKEVGITKKYDALVREYNALQRRYEGEVGYKARTKTPPTIKPRHNNTHSEVVPYIVLSDWHVEEYVDPRTIGGKNEYTLDIAKKRAEYVFQNALKRIEEVGREAKVDHVALFLLGDFITGHLHEENVENAQLGRDDALEFAEELLMAGIQFLLDNTRLTFTCYCKVGNHSRTTEKVRASTEWQNSVEPRMYRSLWRHFKRTGRVNFHMEPSYHSVVDILGTKVRFHHGHAVSYGGGIGGLAIPLRKAIKSWNENERADLDIMGHYHSYKDNSTLRHVVNGSLIGYNAYAERVKATLEPPLQAFGVIHKKYGHVRPTPLFGE